MKKSRGPTLSFRAKGPLAIFTRPELKTERVSYEVPTPSAVRAIFEAICWKPAIQWHVERIYLFNNISFSSIKRNELNSKSVTPSQQMMDFGKREFTHGIYGIDVEFDRAQRNTIALQNVDYQFEAFFTLTKKAGKDDNIYKFIDMFSRRVANGQHFHQPYFGCRECIAEIFLPIEHPEDHAIPLSKELGIMLWDIEFGAGAGGKRQNTPLFFHAKLENGKIDVPLSPIGREEVSYDIESTL